MLGFSDNKTSKEWMSKMSSNFYLTAYLAQIILTCLSIKSFIVSVMPTPNNLQLDTHDESVCSEHEV